MILKNKLLLMLLCIFTFTFTSCSTDDEIPVPTVIRTGSFTVADQTLRTNNLLTIGNVTVTQQSWIVLYKSDPSGDPNASDIISKPKLVPKGESTDVTIQLKDGVKLKDGDVIWAVLHKDTNRLNTFEFDGESGIDMPIMNDAGVVVADSFVVSVLPEPTGSLTVTDQTLMDNVLNIGSVTLDKGGYVVVHANKDGAPVVPAIISTPKYLEAGTHTDVKVTLKESANIKAGDKVWVMLHTDNGKAKVYEFDGKNGFDKPILDASGNIVMKSVTITNVFVTPTGSLTANDQVLTNNNVTIASITMGQSGYVVVHASNAAGDGPMVPEIVSVPVYLEKGTYENVVVPLKASANIAEGDILWAMLHNDSGTSEVYEFDGQNGFDLPIMKNGNIVMDSFKITAIEMEAIAGKLVVTSQPLVNNKLIVESVTLFEDGWVVIHDSNATGTGPMVPEIISVPVYLEAGRHENIEITLLDSANVEVGDTVWIMLHDDTGASGIYEFDGINGLDLPILVDGTVVVKPILITD